MPFEALKITPETEMAPDPENELRDLRKKQYSSLYLPAESVEDFKGLAEKEKAGTIERLDAKRLNVMREKYWTSEDQEKLSRLEGEGKKGLDEEDKKRFRELSKKQTDGAMTEAEQEEIRWLYQHMEK